MTPSLFISSLPHPHRVLRGMSVVRICLICLLLLSLGYVKWYAPTDDFPWGVLLQISVCLVILTIVLEWGQRRQFSLALLLKWGIVMDYGLLTELIYFTGGANNPITVLYILPILCAALFCPKRFAWMMTLASVLVYLALFFWYEPLVPFSTEHSHHHPLLLHLVGMWLSFSLCAILMTWTITNLVSALRQHEIDLQQAYHKQYQQESWLVLGIQASSFAHELSTPLNNLLLLQEEIQSTPNLPKQVTEDIALMGLQLQQCQDSLQRLKYEISQQQQGQLIPLYKELDNRLKRWRNLRPDVYYQWHHEETKQDYLVELDNIFWSAFFNILNNAADASNDVVDLYTHINSQQEWEIIIDNKQGFLNDTQLANAGLNIIESEKPFGMGLGVRMAYATLTHLKGSLTISNRDQGGVQAKITLPLNIKEVIPL